jgi:hypothetical protein
MKASADHDYPRSTFDRISSAFEKALKDKPIDYDFSRGSDELSESREQLDIAISNLEAARQNISPQR